ncbi:MAG: LysR family transcriptional regulator [Xanthobacteraceae bacterium]
MDIISIPSGYSADLDLHQLQVFDVLLRERSLTRAARVLNVTQPALSKTLARLRRCFDDPLFVRVSSRMEPTAKALDLEKPVRAVIDSVRTLRTENVPFDPKTSNRNFTFCVVDAGVIKLLPPLVKFLEKGSAAGAVECGTIRC